MKASCSCVLCSRELRDADRPRFGSGWKGKALKDADDNVAILDAPPAGADFTDYDRQHVTTYVRMLDAERAGAGWEEVARVLLRIDPGADPARARQRYDTHLARAKWIAESGYRDLLRT